MTQSNVFPKSIAGHQSSIDCNVSQNHSSNEHAQKALQAKISKLTCSTVYIFHSIYIHISFYILPRELKG